MSIQSEITRISANVTAALAAIARKGVTGPSGSNSDDLEDLIDAISAGGGSAISIVDELPPGRTPVKTSIVPEAKRQAMYGFLRDEVKFGSIQELQAQIARDEQAARAFFAKQ